MDEAEFELIAKIDYAILIRNKRLISIIAQRRIISLLGLVFPLSTFTLFFFFFLFFPLFSFFFLLLTLSFHSLF